MNRLEIVNLTKSYGKKHANKDISIELENGVYGLLGPNGAGKTTLMNQITTLSQPTSGKILYNGQDVGKLGAEYRNLIGYLPQDFIAYKSFSPKKFLEYVGALKGIDRSSGKVEELLDIVGLYEVRNKAIGKFSGGI